MENNIYSNESIAYIQNTVILLSNEILEKRGELENVQK